MVVITGKRGISTHTLTWSVTQTCRKQGTESGISTHTLTWSVTEKFIRPYAEFEISTHTLTWSVTRSFIGTLFLRNNFNSHANVERDCSQVCMLDKSTISTHTLTWSVTYFQNNNIEISEISTHTLTWSVTGNSHYYISVVHNFNSHAHVERDFSLVKTEIREQAISTHTLTWSVTCLGR